jgi:magnesium transporter
MVAHSNSQVFLFLSQILGKKVVDAEGRLRGKVSDLAASLADYYPLVTGLLYLPPGSKEAVRLPWAKVVEPRARPGFCPRPAGSTGQDPP